MIQLYAVYTLSKKKVKNDDYFYGLLLLAQNLLFFFCTASLYDVHDKELRYLQTFTSLFKYTKDFIFGLLRRICKMKKKQN